MKLLLAILLGWCFLSFLSVWAYCVIRATYIAVYLRRYLHWRVA